jgi:hypothetical protein
MDPPADPTLEDEHLDEMEPSISDEDFEEAVESEPEE